MKNKTIFTIIVLIFIMMLIFTACSPKAGVKSTPTQQIENNDMKTENKVEQVKQDDDMNDNQETEYSGDAYNFELMDVEGNLYKLSDYKKKQVYIKFWATWCSICISGMKEFIEFDEAYKDNEDVIVLTMVAPGVGSEMKEEKFKSWYESQNLEFVALLDNGGDVMRQYGIRGFPTSVFIDSYGDIYDIKPGHVNNQEIKETLLKMD